MRARREHCGTRAGRTRTNIAETKHCAAISVAARTAALCETSGLRRLAGCGAGVCARAGPDGAPARHVPPVARRRRHHRRRTQDGLRGVSTTARGAALELLRRRRWISLRTRHAHRDEGGSVHIRDHLGRRDARAERGVRARRPAVLSVHHQPPPRHDDSRSVRVGRVRRGRVRRAAGAALLRRARARARRARSHEPAQQPRGPEDSEGLSPSRVQVSRRVGVVRGAHVLARAAALPRRRRRAARPLRPRQAGRAAPSAPRTRPAATPNASCACKETEAEPKRGASTTQVRPGVSGALTVVLRARRRRWLIRHAYTDLQQDFQRRGRLRVAVLRAGLQHAAARGGEQVPLPLPLVLPRVVRHMRAAHGDARLQLTAHEARDSVFSESQLSVCSGCSIINTLITAF